MSGTRNTGGAFSKSVRRMDTFGQSRGTGIGARQGTANLRSQEAMVANFKQTVIEKRRKYNQALTLLMSDDKARTGSAGGAPNEKETGQQDPFLNSILNSSLV